MNNSFIKGFHFRFCFSVYPRFRVIFASKRFRSLQHAMALGLALSTIVACYRPPVRVVPKRSATITEDDLIFFRRFPLMVPVDGVRPDQIHDTFYEARDGERQHLATDIMAPRGTPILAATSGRIFRLSTNALGGITIYALDEAGKFVYYYAHLERYADNVTPGMEVQQGDVIGYVGTTGNAPPDTPHLHFQAMRVEVGAKPWWNGTPVDVAPVFSIKGRQGGR